MALLDNIPQEEKFKMNIKHQSDNVDIWCVLLDDMTVKVKHWKIQEKNENLTLREIWLNEVRQLNRLKSIGNSNKYLELLYKSHIDEKGYYLIYETNEETVSLSQFIDEHTDIKQNRPSLKLKLNYHWIHPIGLKKTENRIILWKNILKIVRAIKILHEQGIVHRNISLDTILVDDSQDNNDENNKFKLSGFEWSVYLNTLKKVDYSSIMDCEIMHSSTNNDWWSLGNVIREIFKLESFDIPLTKSEFEILKVLKNDDNNEISYINADFIERYIKNIINELPKYDLKNLIAYITSNDGQDHDGYKRIRNKLGEFLNKDLTYEEVFMFLENDLNLEKIDIRQVQFKNNYAYLLRGKKLIYQVDNYKNSHLSWDIGYIKNIFDKYPTWSDFSEKIEMYNRIQYLKKSKIFSIKNEDIFNWNIIISQFEKDKILNDKEKNCLRGLVLNHAIDTSLLLNQKYNVIYKEIDIDEINKNSKIIFEEGNYYQIELISDKYRDKISQSLSIKKQKDIFYTQFENEEISPEWIIEPIEENEGLRTFSLYYITKIDGKLIFSSKQNINLYLNEGDKYKLYQKSLKGTDVQLERRNHALNKLIDQQNLLESLTDPAQSLQIMSYDYDLSESMYSLDDSKQNIFKKLLTINPNFIVQGPPGVGKTHLIVTLIKQIFKDEKSSKIILTAQSHSTVKVLYDAIMKNCDTNELILIDAFDNDENLEEENSYNKVTKKYIEKFSNSEMFSNVMKTYHEDVKEDLKTLLIDKSSYQFYDSILKSANLIFTTTNSKTLESLIRNNVNFDLSIMEESAKVSGVELISPMLVSHKRIMIGDYLQLPAFGEQVINNIVRNRKLFDYKLILNELNHIGFRKDILHKLSLNSQPLESGENIEDTTKTDVILNLNKYFSIFKFLSNEADKIKERSTESFGDTINTQYRMHPDISNIVSKTVYKDILKDNIEQKEYYLQDSSYPILFENHKFDESINSNKAVIWIDIKDKNDNPNQISDYEENYTNETEIGIIKEVLDTMHLNKNYRKKDKVSIQILSPYRKQVQKININLKHHKLNQGFFIESGTDIARTVDSFQGGEADVIIISLVRHNSFTPYTKALGFLMDMRRMNVLLSRAKYKMIIIGCFKMFKYWSDYIENNPELRKEVCSELESNNLNFLNSFVNLATPDYNLMLDKSISQNIKKFNYINFVSSDILLECGNHE